MQSRIGWIDPDNGFDKHNLIFDLPKNNDEAVFDEEGGAHPIFSVVKHYPPKWQRRLQIEREMVGNSPSKCLSIGSRDASTPLF